MFAGSGGSHLWPGRLDRFAEQLRGMLFAGKFNSPLSPVSGIGFTIQFARMDQRDQIGGRCHRRSHGTTAVTSISTNARASISPATCTADIATA